MNPHEILRRFPLASKSLLAANAADYGPGTPAPVKAIVSAPPIAEPSKPAKIGKRRKAMNKTETAFSAMLSARMQAGEIVSFEYEGMTLRWGKLDNIQYTPDFVVFERIETDKGAEHPLVRIVFIESKGAHIWAKDMAKFKQARNEWPLFRFELWKLVKGEWSQIY